MPEVIADNGARHGFATILESLGSGCAAMDFDRDDLPDAIIAGGGDFDGRRCIGKPVFVLRNRRTHLENTTSASAIGTTRHYHHGICAADYNHDGFEDFLVTGFGGMQLFCNQGDGTFTETAAATELMSGGWSASAAWADFNHDGFLDVYVTGYVNWSFENDPPCFAADGVTRDNCSPKLFEALPDKLFISGGDGTFTNQSAAFNVRPDGKALGVVAADLNADGFLDLYVGNDVMMNFLYRNEAGTSFTDWSMFGGAGGSRRGSPDASMGVDVVDFDNDGRFDIWAANFEMESFALYQNLGKMQFRHVSDVTGVSAIGGQYVGWGTAFTDLDLDGDCDTVVCNGNVVQHPKHSPTLQKMVLLENVNGHHFEDVTEQVGPALLTPQHGRGLAWTDWNRDGKVDLLVTPTHAPAQLLENRSNVNGSSLTLQLIGTKSPRQPIGTTVTLITSSGTQTKQLIGGGSYASTSLPEIHFGVPRGSTPTEVRIKWPSGTSQLISLANADDRLVVIEQRAVAVRPPH
ncbi:MAG: CRTAC1 family protein [Fuerstiella sp.]|nr:CRTAC1 family protein [Fuerstiella sp.]MCP4856771.1 CRTAC1 family protein [Fuerstiella sp.]